MKSYHDVTYEWFKNNHPLVQKWEAEGVKWVLHHWDKTLKHTNKSRYDMWLFEDLVLVTSSFHTHLHMIGKIESAETRYKKSVSHTSTKLSEEHRTKISESLIGHKGCTFTEEECKRRSDRMLGDNNIAKRPDVRKKLSENNPMKNPEIAHKQHLSQIKRVRCIDNGIIFEYAKKAEEWSGVRAGDIQACCRGNQKTAGGLHWEYYTEGGDVNEES